MNMPVINDIIPEELIRMIFGYLPPCDIVRFRRVSKQFRDISLDPLLWKGVYASASLPRPPGPFPWQSTQYLEHTLVRSDLLSRTWTSQPAKTILNKPSQWPGIDSDERRARMGTILHDRWCIWWEETGIHHWDVDTGHSGLLYASRRGGPSPLQGNLDFNWQAYAVTGTTGRHIFVMTNDFSRPKDPTILIECNVLEDGSLSEPKVSELRHFGLGPQQHGMDQSARSQCHLYEPTPFLALQQDDIGSGHLILDLNTRSLYKLPTLTQDAVHELGSLIRDDGVASPFVLLVLTRMHIIALWLAGELEAEENTLLIVVQAFVPPESPGATKLCLTHQAVVWEEYKESSDEHACVGIPPSSILLRNSVVDPVTNAISMEILYSMLTPVRPKRQLSHLHLTLPESLTHDVLPIHIRKKIVMEGKWFSEYLTASDDGHARGILMCAPVEDEEAETRRGHYGSDDADADEEHLFLRKFVIDGSKAGEGCIVEIGSAAKLYFPDDLDLSWEGIKLNGFSGRLHSLGPATYVSLDIS